MLFFGLAMWISALPRSRRAHARGRALAGLGQEDRADARVGLKGDFEVGFRTRRPSTSQCEKALPARGLAVTF